MKFWRILTLMAWVLNSPAWAGTVDEAQILVEQQRYEQALARLENHLGKQPQDPRARFLKGMALTGLQRGPEAITVFRNLTVDYPELPEPYNNLAVLQAQAGRLEEARKALEIAIRIQPRNATTFENLGDVHLRLAAQSFLRAAELKPGSDTLRARAHQLQELSTKAPRP